MKAVTSGALALVLAAAMLPAESAQANDSTAQLAAGGLVLTRNDAIEMRSEDLYISREAVRVRYRFVNSSGRDTSVRVAFPMPDIGGEGFFEGDVSVPVNAPANILGFVTLVDGKPVQTILEQKAMVGSTDHRAWLVANRIPVAMHLGGTDAAIAGLSAAKRSEALKLGLIDEDVRRCGSFERAITGYRFFLLESR